MSMILVLQNGDIVRATDTFATGSHRSMINNTLSAGGRYAKRVYRDAVWCAFFRRIDCPCLEQAIKRARHAAFIRQSKKILRVVLDPEDDVHPQDAWYDYYANKWRRAPASWVNKKVADCDMLIAKHVLYDKLPHEITLFI